LLYAVLMLYVSINRLVFHLLQGPPGKDGMPGAPVSCFDSRYNFIV